MPVFKSAFGYESDKEYDGRECNIVGLLCDPNNPDHTQILHPDNMPQFEINFVDTGEVYSAYATEIDPQHWTQDMHDYMAGENAFAIGATCALADPARRHIWQLGFEKGRALVEG